jgi:ABC-type uncharacterized transport system substrate-binding protein
MKIRNFDKLMAGVFLVLFSLYIVYEVGRKPRVLVLHSYDAEYSWVEQVSEGITRVLGDKPYSIRWHYMDTKRHPGAAFMQRAGQSAREVIERWQPAVVITVADNAQELVGKQYINDPRLSIVYSGMFATPEVYGYDSATNVTGILERWPLDVIRNGISDIFLSARPADAGKLRIYHVGDSSETVDFLAQQIARFDWGPDLEVVTMQPETFAQWQQAIAVANDEADLVLFSLYHTLTDEGPSADVVPPAQVMQWTQANLRKPNVAGWGFSVEEGGMMAIGVSALEQGEEAARMVVKIIDDDVPPAEIPSESSKQFLIYLRQGELAKYDIVVPQIFEAFARATNNYFIE